MIISWYYQSFDFSCQVDIVECLQVNIVRLSWYYQTLNRSLPRNLNVMIISWYYQYFDFSCDGLLSAREYHEIIMILSNFNHVPVQKSESHDNLMILSIFLISMWRACCWISAREYHDIIMILSKLDPVPSRNQNIMIISWYYQSFEF